MADYVAIRKYTSELINATLNDTIPPAVPDNLTIAELIEISQKGQMQYLLLHSLIKVVTNISDIEIIRKELEKSTIKTFFQVMLAKKITAAFELNGIRHQLLKGAVTKFLYPSPEMRDMSDIDIVVFDENLDRAAHILEEMGFDNYGLVKHHMIFSSPQGIIVEVHWCLFDKNVGMAQYLYFKNDFKSKLKENKEYTYEFSDEDFYVYMIAHMAKHFFETGCGIRNLVDIFIYINSFGKSMDNDYLYVELKKCGILDFEKNMRELAFIWLQDKECMDVYDDIFEYMVESGIYGKRKNGIWSQLAKETSAGKANVVIHYFFPSINFMKEKYKWLRKAPYLLPIAWIIRGVTGVMSEESKEHFDTFEGASKEHIDKMLGIYHRLNLNFRR